MADYQLQRDPRTGTVSGVLRRADAAFVPKDPDNRDWQVFVKWRQDGGNPDPADADRPDDKRTVNRLLRALIRKGVLTRADVDLETDD